MKVDEIIVKDRIRKDSGGMMELINDIKANGLINPITINTDHVLLAGYRRLTACKALGMTDIPVHMVSTKSEEQDLKVEISENEIRRERISVSDSRRLKQAVHARCFYVLGILHSNGVVAEESIADYKHYFGKFCSRCYTDARAKSRLGTPYYDTRKQDYEEVMNYIKSWEPEVQFDGKTGTEAYKAYLDRMSESF